MSTQGIRVPKQKRFCSSSGSLHQGYRCVQQQLIAYVPPGSGWEHPLTIRPEKDSWKEMGNVPHQRSWGQRKTVFSCFCLRGRPMLKSGGLHQFWSEHGAATADNEMPGCAWIDEAGGASTNLEAHSSSVGSTWCSWGQCHPAPSPREDCQREEVFGWVKA